MSKDLKEVREISKYMARAFQGEQKDRTKALRGEKLTTETARNPVVLEQSEQGEW